MRAEHDKPAENADQDRPVKVKRTKNRNGTVAVRVERGHFKKGHSGNPKGAPKQIFHTTKPFKQALMRALQDRTDRKAQDELQKIADKLVQQALTSRFPLGAISQIADRLDGSPEKEPAAPQVNTLQLVMNSIRVLNLTPEQRDAFAKQLIAQSAAPDRDGGGERT